MHVLNANQLRPYGAKRTFWIRSFCVWFASDGQVRRVHLASESVAVDVEVEGQVAENLHVSETNIRSWLETLLITILTDITDLRNQAATQAAWNLQARVAERPPPRYEVVDSQLSTQAAWSLPPLQCAVVMKPAWTGSPNENQPVLHTYGQLSPELRNQYCPLKASTGFENDKIISEADWNILKVRTFPLVLWCLSSEQKTRLFEGSPGGTFMPFTPITPAYKRVLLRGSGCSLQDGARGTKRQCLWSGG